jgi:hypothetical protein
MYRRPIWRRAVLVVAVKVADVVAAMEEVVVDAVAVEEAKSMVVVSIVVVVVGMRRRMHRVHLLMRLRDRGMRGSRVLITVEGEEVVEVIIAGSGLIERRGWEYSMATPVLSRAL